MAHKIELDLFVRGICTGHRGRSVADDLRESSECPLRPLRLLEEKFFELARVLEMVAFFTNEFFDFFCEFQASGG
jgi:hypothetical protein